MAALTLSQPAAASTPAANRSPWAALPVFMAGTFMIVLDFFIVNVALPSTGRPAGRRRHD